MHAPTRLSRPRHAPQAHARIHAAVAPPPHASSTCTHPRGCRAPATRPKHMHASTRLSHPRHAP
eukprot:361875-Chlamydomonas_euryale.AAC.1